ncbi:MAG TPA: hypothetical protein VK306_04260 [Acidimicrobiales bacterium]|nr:hypothetical protein [Acidimicrobiales bacterium]
MLLNHLELISPLVDDRRQQLRHPAGHGRLGRLLHARTPARAPRPGVAASNTIHPATPAGPTPAVRSRRPVTSGAGVGTGGRPGSPGPRVPAASPRHGGDQSHPSRAAA